MPRPRKWSDPRRSAVLLALKHGATRRDAALGAGVRPETLGEWMEQGASDALEEAEQQEGGETVIIRTELAEFCMAVLKAEAGCANGIARRFKEAAETDWRAAESWLKRRRKDEWSEKGEGAAPRSEDDSDLTPEQRLERIIALLDAARARRDFEALAGDGGA